MDLNQMKHDTKRNRTYPDLNVDDNVNIYKKRCIRQRNILWSAKTYTIESITVSQNQKFYKLGGMGKVHMRHELLNI